MCRREVRAEVVRGERDRGSPAAIGSIDAGRGSYDGYTDLECRLRSRGYYEGSSGGCGMVASLLTDIFLTVCFFRWKGVNGRYSTGFGLVVSRGTVIALADLGS